MVPSPCIKVCTLNEKNICIGCKRTIAEIKDWRTMTEKEKEDVIKRISLIGDYKRV